MVEITEPSLTWQTTDSKYILENSFFKIREDQCLNQFGVKTNPFYTCEISDSVTAIARTVKGTYLIQKTFRQSIGKIYYELPAGCIDKTDPSPLEAMKRELLEETGYGFSDYIFLGSLSFNAALVNSQTYIFFADNGLFAQKPELECGEAFVLEEIDLPTLKKFALDGSIFQALHVAAIHRFLSLISS